MGCSGRLGLRSLPPHTRKPAFPSFPLQTRFFPIVFPSSSLHFRFKHDFFPLFSLRPPFISASNAIFSQCFPFGFPSLTLKCAVFPIVSTSLPLRAPFVPPSLPLQVRYSLPSRLLRGCFTVASWLLRGCFRVAPGLLQGCCRVASRAHHGEGQYRVCSIMCVIARPPLPGSMVTDKRPSVFFFTIDFPSGKMKFICIAASGLKAGWMAGRSGNGPHREDKLFA